MRRLPLLLALAALALTLVPVGGAAALSLSAPEPEGDWTLGGEPCDLIEVPAAAPVGTGTCPGVRPGAIVVSDAGQCTMNFLFEGGGNRYIGTAGHCILGEGPTSGDVGEESWAPGTGPVATDGDGNPIGRYVYAILEDPKDFALIQLDDGVEASPQMCHFGGPTGINTDTPGLDSPTVINHYGNGLGVGLVLPARTILALGMPDEDHVYGEGVVVPGDSGSGVTDEQGRAIGVVVTTGVHSSSIGTSGIDVGLVGITRLAPQLARASDVLNVSLSLVTAPTL